MIIVESRISHVTRNRDFGMVEACVTLLAWTAPGHHAQPLRIRTHVPARGHDLRARLVADAVGLTRHLKPGTPPLPRA